MKVDSLGNGPLVSVVIPTYNRADYIVEAVESVLNQSYRNFEIIVIDDGSTDETARVIGPFRSQVNYVFQQNAERGASRNHGLRLAKGEFVAFLDSDDLWLPTKLAEDVAILASDPGIGVVYTDSRQVDSGGKELRKTRVAGPSGRVTAAMLKRNLVSMGAHLVRTHLVREIGGFREERELAGAEDWEMWVRLSLRTNFAYNPTATTKIRTHHENTMTNPAAMRRSLGRAAELLHNFEPLASNHCRALRRMDANLALVNAINYCTASERNLSLRFLAEAAAVDPLIVLDPRYTYTILRLLKVAGRATQPLSIQG